MNTANRIVGIHGIGHEFLTAPQLESRWLEAIQGGLEVAGYPRNKREEFAMVSYGDIFRQPGTKGISHYDERDIEEGWEEALLIAWWQEAAMLSAENRDNNDPLGEDSTIQGPELSGKGRTPVSVQRALKQLSKSKFFKALGSPHILIFGLKQVRKFLYDPDIKKAILQRVEELVSSDTNVIIGHSLGSVVAYEALCAHPEWRVHTLVTLGSPLGIQTLIFDALTPKPDNGQGKWPNVVQWFNIADKGDIVALEKDLAPLFKGNANQVVNDKRVYNGWESHSVEIYLTARETGEAIAKGLY